MSKVTLSDITSIDQTSPAALTANFEAIQEAIDNTLSRDGTSPNEMESDLDMDSFRILNLPAPVGLTEPVRLQDVADGVTVTVIDDSFGVTPFIETLLDDSTAYQARTTLGTKHKLTANTNFYVRTDGSNSNDGLANTAGGAWLTLQGAIDNLYKNWDFGSFAPTLNVGAGTFAPFSVAHPWSGGDYPRIVGAGVGSTIIEATGNGQSLVFVTDMSVIDISGVSLSAGAFTGVVGLDASQSGILDFGTISFGAMSVGIRVFNQGMANQTGNLTVAGSMDAFAQVFSLGRLNPSSTITVNGSLTITHFLNVQSNGLVNTGGVSVTFAGAGAGSGTTGT